MSKRIQSPLQKFQRACYWGRLEEAQSIYANNPEINISSGNEEAFRIACRKGNIHIIEWLYSIKDDIDIYKHRCEAFRWACWNGHISIAKWFQNIDPSQFHIMIDEENGAIIEYKLLKNPEWNYFHH